MVRTRPAARVTRIFVPFACLAVIMQAGEAVACWGPHSRVFPTCQIASPQPNERTTVIYVNSGKGLSSVTLGSDTIVTEVVDVEIEPAGKPHYIALSSGKPIIWRFSGRVDTISQVIMLGSQYDGARRSGVIGVARDRIHFTKPDQDPVRSHWCHARYAACELSAYFDIPEADRMTLADQVPEQRHPVDQFVEHIRGGVIRIPGDGWVRVTDQARGRYESWSHTDYIETSQTHELGLIKIDAGSVVSPEEVRGYRTLPAVAGLKQLLQSGALLAAGTPHFKAAYEKWNEAISKPYRSRFDANFLFSYKVDYLITKPVVLPASLDKTAFLVAENVDIPDLLGIGSTRACLFFADQRKLDVKQQRDPRCDASKEPVLPERQRELASMARTLDKMRLKSAADKAKCLQAPIEGSTYFAGIIAQTWFRSDISRWLADDTSRRRVDVVVKRPGKVALYLERSTVGIQWHVSPSQHTEIATVLLGGNSGDKVYGVDSFVPVRPLLIKSGDKTCDRYHPSRYAAHPGGPFALALDESLAILTGRGLNQLLLTPSPDSPRVTFVIE